MQQRTLILTLSQLGDVVSAMVVVDRLRRCSAAVDLLVRPAVEPLLRDEPGVAVVTPEHAMKQRYDLLVDLTSTRESRALVRRIRARRKVGQYSFLLKVPRLALTYTRQVKKHAHGHIVRDFYPVLRLLGEPGAPVPRLRAPGDARVERALSEVRGGAARLVGLHFGAAGEKRVLPTELVAGLVRRLAELDARVLLIGQEQDLIAEILRETDGLPRHVPFDLNELKSALAGLDFFVGTDSGPLHLAAALGVPALGIYGPNLSSISGPLQEGVEVLELDYDCRPCDQTEPCPHDLRCLRDIRVEAVMARIERRLFSTAPA